jgi:hypothetical protein
MMPGTQPSRVRTSTIRMLPQPLSITAIGGRITHNIALKTPMCLLRFLTYNFYFFRKTMQLFSEKIYQG